MMTEFVSTRKEIMKRRERQGFFKAATVIALAEKILTELARLVLVLGFAFHALQS